MRLARRISRRALGEQRLDDAAGGAAGAEHQRRAGLGSPVRRLLAQVGDEAVAVGIVGVDRAVGAEGQGVGGADRGGAVAGGGGQRQRRLLVRDGDVHAAEPERRAARAGRPRSLPAAGAIGM